MKTILHLERKFCSKTETFIADQINFISTYNVVVGTIKHLQNLPTSREVIVPPVISRLSHSARMLTDSTSKSLWESLSRHQCDVLHVHYLVDALFYIKIARMFNGPKIVSAYGYDVGSFPKGFGGLNKHILSPIFTVYDYFLAMSPDMRDDLIAIGCPPEKVIVHYYGINASRFYSLQDGRQQDSGHVSFLSVGSLIEKKGHAYTLRAMAQLRDEYGFDDFSYVIVGAGSDSESLKRLATDLQLDSRVTFEGHVGHKEPRFLEFYKNADIFLHPSVTASNNDKEGIPGTIVEAMATGLPVITTYHAGIPHIITNGKNGLLVPERDSRSIAAAMATLVRDRITRQRLGEAAKRKVRSDLDAEVRTRNLEAIYTMALEKMVAGK